MGLISEFREFAVKGNAMDLAVGVIVGAAFGRIVSSLVEDVLMPPIGKLVGNLDFSNLYFSLSDKVDAANAKILAARAATQPAADSLVPDMTTVTSAFDTASRIPLAEARALGPVIAYGSFLTVFINFLIVAFCVFLLVKAINTLRRQPEPVDAAPPAPPEDVKVLMEIRDLLSSRRD